LGVAELEDPSLGSCSLPLGQRRIKELQQAERARMGHCRRQLNTILNTKPRAPFFRRWFGARRYPGVPQRVES
jgi:hypothetical protein